jgi:hypothetical protein
MTSFHLPHLPPPYHQPRCIVQLADRLLQASYVKNLTRRTVTPADDGHPLDWSAISGNVIATVLGAIAVAGLGSIFFLAYQVPRQQEQILTNQVEMKQAMRDLTDRLQRLELNDRRQDERIIRQEHR